MPNDPSDTAPDAAREPRSPELRVAITIPLPADPFAAATLLREVQPALDEAVRSIARVCPGARFDTRQVTPKPAGVRAKKGGEA